MIRVGIVGTGRTFKIAHYHLNGILSDGRAEVSAVLSSSVERAEEWIESNRLSAHACRSYEELLSQVDAVVICTPNFLHADQVMKAIESDKHILVEKPCALTVKDCDRLEEALKGYGRANMVSFTYRFSKAVQLAGRMISERLGRIYLFNAMIGGSRLADPSLPIEWRMRSSLSGSGALGDFGSHAVDLAFFLCGQRYTELSCMRETVIPERPSANGPGIVDNDDVALFLGRSRNGLGSFSLSRVGMVDPRFLVVGEGGTVEIDLQGRGKVTFMEKRLDGPYTGKVESCVPERGNEFSEMLKDQMKAFLDLVEKKEVPVATIDQGCYVERILLSAERASGSNHTIGL